MTVRLICLQSHEVEAVWPRIEKWCEDAMLTSQGKYTASSILSHALSKKVQFWIGIDEVEDDIKIFGITQIADFPNARVCEIVCVTGKQKELWEHKMPDIELWARHQGCTVMEIYTRIGWERILNKYGYKKTHSILNKNIGE